MLTIAICSSMKEDLTALLGSAIRTKCSEILVIGNVDRAFNYPIQDPRLRFITGPPDLAGKRNIALKEAKSDFVAFIDDDAVLSDTWYDAVAIASLDPQVGIVTGPSMLPETASFWERVCQLVMASAQYSHKRYTFARRGYGNWWDVIGANVVFRKRELLSLGGCPSAFLAQGDDMAMAYKMYDAGWRVFYDPAAYVFHKPHKPIRQVVQIYKFGRAAARLKRAGMSHPSKDKTYLFFVPLYVVFGVAYFLGILLERTFGWKPQK